MAERIDAETLAVFIQDAFDVLGQWERFCFNLKPTDSNDSFSLLMRCAHNLKGSAGLAGFDNLHHRLHAIEDYLVKLRDTPGLGVVPFDQLVSTLLEVEKEIHGWMDRLKDDPDFELTIDSSGVEAKLKRIAVGEASTIQANETTKADKPTSPAAAHGAGATSQLPTTPASEITIGRQRETKSDETLRVSAGKLDRLIQLVGEISLNQSILVRSAAERTLDSHKTRDVIDLNSKLVQDLQAATLDLRMIPVEGLFQKIERMVRDTASRLNKQVKVERIGDDVALDKLIVEGMVEPLIHIARNAVDHGIEGIDARKKTGKDMVGCIRLSAEHTSTGVNLIFEDDGKGIDGETVFKKAVQRGLIDGNQELTPGGKLQLIFLPGLSTAENVTELSGRGVGMDVVASEVQRMAGQVEVQSEVGKGTRIQIALPTNLSIVDAIVIRSIGGLYAVPNRDIAEVIDLRDFPVSSIDGDFEKVFDFRGRIVPLAEVDYFLSSAAVRAARIVMPQKPGRPKPCLIVKHHEDLIGLSVEGIVGQQQVFVRPLLGHLVPIAHLSGTTILSDGEPCMILNLPELARQYFTSQ